MVSVLLDGVSKVYEDEPAVADLSLRIESGEAVALLGPSGSGKTTILRMIAGLESPTSGDVLFDGRPADDRPNLRDVTMLFADNRLFPKMTARNNIGFPLSVRKTPEPERTHRIEAEASALGIERLLERMPSALSAGESNLVHLAKAMVRAPGLFLIDEPLAAIDSRARLQVRAILRDIQRGYGATALYATHDQDDAMALADRVVVIDRGRIRQSGGPREVYDAPDDTFVATFVGSPEMNLLDGVRTAGGVSLGGLHLTAPRDIPDRVLVGVRPAYWRVSQSGLSGKVSGVADWGGAVFVSVVTDSGELEMRWDDSPPTEGDDIVLTTNRFHLFDAASGRAVFHRVK